MQTKITTINEQIEDEIAALERGKMIQTKITTINGPMFSGKTTELLNLIRRARADNQRVQVFKLDIDNRYSNGHIQAHNKELEPIAAIIVKCAEEILPRIDENTNLVAIDEGQFFSEYLVTVCTTLANRGVSTLVAGLDMNFRGEPWKSMALLMGVADQVIKMKHAKCSICGEVATHTQRLRDGSPAHSEEGEVVIGGSEIYEARCRWHHEVPPPIKLVNPSKYILGDKYYIRESEIDLVKVTYIDDGITPDVVIVQFENGAKKKCQRDHLFLAP